ncbi:E3 ubiquitin ligase family protein [uncultured Thermosynechococcus sp.]|uniref:E3 ubiquitin ligase family protein n=1 Tax=uncultured Thermosynechococcus sp. TaxID=436945 RepID=UPI0026160440|nr:E3 ubiquitin ligase family protein [uncultured Thermosynechococcus sp.]
MGVFSHLCFIGSALLFCLEGYYRLKLKGMKVASPSSIGELQQCQRQVAQEIGSGSWREYVQVFGQVTTSQPLLSEVKRIPCVYYKTIISREDKKEGSDRRNRRERHSEIIGRHEQSTLFFLRDQQGQIEVNPLGAEIEAVQVLDELRPADKPHSFSLSLGFLSLNWRFGNPPTLGYRYQEWVLPLGQPVSVVGMASDQGGVLRLQKPQSRGQKFIISLSFEDQLIREYKQQRRKITYASLSAALCGVCGLVLSLF